MTTVASAADVGGVTGKIIAKRIRFYMSEKGWSERETGRKAGIGEGTVGAFLRRLETGEQKNLTTETASKLADAFGVPVSSLYGLVSAGTDVPFVALSRWAHETPSIAKVLLLHPDEVTVGDLIRYRTAPSSRGEHDAKEVFAHMMALRKEVSEGVDVTLEQEAAVGPRGRRARKKRGT